ncbi:hypothetical protein M0804_014895 [Polistes exclamans]|nr:hypothetical protein M0804_014895 [Polistes exclamans]
MQCPSQETNATMHDCDVQDGTKLPALTHLIYTCNSGYQLNSSSDVFCDQGGNWSDIPVCTESSGLLGTNAVLSRRNDREEVAHFQFKEVNEDTECGVVSPKYSPFITNGSIFNETMIPWHATLYSQEFPNGPKKFICGATIVKKKFLLAAAHCVYDDTIKSINDPNKYYILTGNIYRDYDSTQHDERFVKKARVKDIYVPSDYKGYEGNYANDIAILEIEIPFVLSSTLTPACINGDIFQSGIGLVSGFGKTHEGTSSFILQSVLLPYVPRDQCKSRDNSSNSYELITEDKFCVGYANGTAVCDGDSGGGFVSSTGNLVFLRGIVSLSLDFIGSGGTTTCDSYSYSLLTRISSHINWIENIIS